MILDLNEQQVGFVLSTLAGRPYAEVADLISVIHQQASAQLAPKHVEPGTPVLRAINGSGERADQIDEAPGH